MRWMIVLVFFCTPLVSFAIDTYEYRLQNGLKLVVREDHRAPTVVSSVWYKVGGSYEHDGLTGTSHMLEHMMFKGTKRFGPGQLNKIVNQNGGQQNAMTSQDFTAYYQELTADKLRVSFELEADRMKHLQLQQSSYDKEHQVVMEERRMRVDDNPQGLTWERFNAAAFLNSPYHHPVVGWMTDLRHLTLGDLKSWYHTWYAPNNATVVVVGDVKAAHVFNLAKKYFGPLKAVPTTTLKPRTETPSIGLRTVEVQAPAKLPWLVMGYNVPALKTTKDQWQAYALSVLAAVLSEGESARLSHDLVRGQRVAVDAGASYEGLYGLHSGLLVLEGTPTARHSVVALKAAFLKEISRLRDGWVGPAELKRVKAQVIASNVYKKDSMMRQMYDIALPEVVGLSWRDSRAFVSRIEAVTPQQIRQVAREFLTQSNLTIGDLMPKARVKGGKA
jgi:zinc protease